MKKLFTSHVLLLLTFTLSHLPVKADTWTQKATFPGSNRVGPFSFSIGTKGYIGCGYDTNWSPTRAFWEYDQVSNSWTQKADFLDSARVYATGFSIGSYGYAGIGVSPAAGWMNDFCKYDPALNTWSAIDSFPGGGRSEAISFVVNNKAYVGTGVGTVAPYIFNDLWEYDPATNIWTAKASMPGQARSKAIGFADGANGYIVTGFASTIYFSDLWQYNPPANSWIQKANFPPDPRNGAAGFSLYGEMYVGTGNNHPAIGSPYPSKDWWRYNMVTNQWTQKNSFFGAGRYETGYFPIGNKGYVGIGVNANLQYKDFWEYTPDLPSGINEFQVSSALGGGFEISQNPVKELLVIRYSLSGKESLKLTITNVQGKIVYSQKPETKINVSHFPQGLYLVELTNGKEKAVKRFVKE